MFTTPPPPKKFWFDPLLSACRTLISKVLARWFLFILTLFRTIDFPLAIEQHLGVTVPRRERRLTIPLDRTLLPWKRRETNVQRDCVLFQLPAEIRMLVYEEYMRGNGDGTIMGRRFGKQAWRDGGMDVLPLLVTCRRVYSEAIFFLYSAPTLTFLSPEALILFNGSIPLHRRASIRYVELDTSKLNAQNVHLYLNNPRRLLHSRQASQYLTHRRLSEMQWRDATFWITACSVLEEMEGLKNVSVIVKLSQAAAGSLEEWKPPWVLLDGLEKLMERGVGIEVHVTGVVRRGCGCNICCGDAAWKVRNGTMTVRKKMAEMGRWCIER